MRVLSGGPAADADAGISFDLAALPEMRRRIPPGDFADERYDVDRGVATTDALVVLSTPRSGSTLLCELLRVNDACLAHEYFQPGQYMPILADRWGCLRGARLDEAAYVASLCRYRTYPGGCLGINLHGSHLRFFSQMEPHLRDVRVQYLHIVRRNSIAQAVSYHVASQTLQWSSEFQRTATPTYSFAEILERLQRIEAQNALIQAFLIARGLDCLTVYYEDLVAETEATLRRIPALASVAPLRTESTLQRQAGEQSREWARRFAEELLARGIPVPRADRGRFQRARRRLFPKR